MTTAVSVSATSHILAFHNELSIHKIETHCKNFFYFFSSFFAHFKPFFSLCNERAYIIKFLGFFSLYTISIRFSPFPHQDCIQSHQQPVCYNKTGDFMYYIYILRCVDNTLYTGITNHLEKRMREHFTHDRRAAKYTLSHPPVMIEVLLTCDTRSTASKVEYALKHLSKAQKEAFIVDYDQTPPFLKETKRLYAFPLLHLK